MCPSVYKILVPVKMLAGGINPFPNKPLFLYVCRTSLLKTVGKGGIARNEQYLLFPVFSILFENFLSFLSKLKLLSAIFFRLEESKICSLREG